MNRPTENQPTECPGCGAPRKYDTHGGTVIVWLCNAQSRTYGDEWKLSESRECLRRQRDSLRVLLSPTGTKRERQERLVEVARRMGFKQARDALWDEAAPEWPIDCIEDMADNAGVGEVCPVILGVNLNATVYVTSRWSDGQGGDAGGDVEAGVFDTDAEARAWARALEAAHTHEHQGP